MNTQPEKRTAIIHQRVPDHLHSPAPTNHRFFLGHSWTGPQDNDRDCQNSSNDSLSTSHYVKVAGMKAGSAWQGKNRKSRVSAIVANDVRRLLIFRHPALHELDQQPPYVVCYDVIAL